MGTCKTIETAVGKDFEGGLVEQSFKIDDNKAFFQENLESKNEIKSNEDD